MPVEKEQNINQTKRPNRLKTLIGWISSLILFAGFGYLVYLGIGWCEYTHFLDIEMIEVSGNSILSGGDLRKIAGIKPGVSLLKIDPHQIQNRLELEPYVDAAVVSREFPDRLKIMIKERIPVCYLNSGTLWLIDQNGIILPLPKERLKTNLPIITGFENDSARCRPGLVAPNPEMLKALNLVQTAALKTSALYAEISEIYAWRNGEFIIYTVHGGTPIYLGRGDLTKQLYILAMFQSIIKSKRDFADYQYLDLRWEKQIIARERKS
ncbi:MAG: FtsQ-type POTRA domain-containing protein [Candidatus Marinimicrobia bacterium]|jgi:cell division protein FtsQ|nr:FtsQ-type POTRA domain-containing protein [Candidatus Neomarinimicrobiota bacterium]MCK9560322.1 FtsQ-type POTRA domain-containing protein [Candidatus Neomarinimicrobiota bacterium]